MATKRAREIAKLLKAAIRRTKDGQQTGEQFLQTVCRLGRYGDTFPFGWDQVAESLLMADQTGRMDGSLVHHMMRSRTFPMRIVLAEAIAELEAKPNGLTIGYAWDWFRDHYDMLMAA